LTPSPPRQNDVQPTAFGSAHKSADGKQEDHTPNRPVTVLAWAKPAATGAVKTWLPGRGEPRARPAAKTRNDATVCTDKSFEASAGEEVGREDPASSEAEAQETTESGYEEHAGGESTPPPGMLLISERELAQREADLEEALREPYLEAARHLLRVIGEIEQRLRDDVVDLAARIASVLTNRLLQHDRTITLDIAQRALRLLGPLERVVVKCAEVDAELLREHLPALARAEAGRVVEVIVRPSDDIQPGGLLLTFDGGVVDAREERRLARIVDAVKAAVQESDALLEAEREENAPEAEAMGDGGEAE